MSTAERAVATFHDRSNGGLDFSEDSLSIVEEMLAASECFDIDAFDDLSRAPLHYAVEGDSYQAAQLLLELGANVNRHEEELIGETPLSLAVQGEYPEIVELLMAHGADPDIQGWVGLTARIRAKKRRDDAGRHIAVIIESFG
ncbi:MAG: ankyrin repeat domain-containing protein [Duganella sp.]